MITKIIIKGESGYGSLEQAYKDSLTVTANSIAYLYTPYKESESNPARKWRYVTSSSAFRKLWDQLTETIPSVFAHDDDPWVTDIGDTTFIITYDDGSRVKKNYGLPGEIFKDVFCIVKQMVPGCEYTPAVIVTGEDYFD